MPYRIIPYHPDLRDRVCALYAHLVGPDAALNAAYFAWKHERNPYAAGPVAYLAMAADAVIGMRGFMGANWLCGAGGATCPWLCACDMVVAPAHRGNGLIRRIMGVAMEDLARRGHGTVLSLSASPITYLSSRGMGWRLARPYARWRVETGRGRRLRQARRRIGQTPFLWRYADAPVPGLSRPGFRALDRRWSDRSGPAGPTLAREAQPGAMADLVRQSGSTGIRHVRDAEYYAWRFGNPLNAYRFVFQPGEKQGLDGFLVLQCPAGAPAAALNIVDWEAATPEILRGMLDAVVRGGGYDSLSIWSATLPAETRSDLARLGFAPVDDSRGVDGYAPGLLIAPAAGDPPGPAAPAADRNPIDADAWDLRMIYSDAY